LSKKRVIPEHSGTKQVSDMRTTPSTSQQKYINMPNKRDRVKGNGIYEGKCNLLASVNPNDSTNRTTSLTGRYADDFLLGFRRPKDGGRRNQGHTSHDFLERSELTLSAEKNADNAFQYCKARFLDTPSDNDIAAKIENRQFS